MAFILRIRDVSGSKQGREGIYPACLWYSLASSEASWNRLRNEQQKNIFLSVLNFVRNHFVSLRWNFCFKVIFLPLFLFWKTGPQTNAYYWIPLLIHSIGWSERSTLKRFLFYSSKFHTQLHWPSYNIERCNQIIHVSVFNVLTFVKWSQWDSKRHICGWFWQVLTNYAKSTPDGSQ